jgi:hypothetical protein
MKKPDRGKKPGGPQRPEAREVAFSPEAQELRALLRRVPDGFQATLKALAGKPVDARERVMSELARGMGKDALPLVKAAALGAGDDLARSAFRVLPIFGTRAAADVLVEAHKARGNGDFAVLAWQSALALQARGINIEIPEPDGVREQPGLVLRETHVSAPDGVGNRAVAARLQDQYGVWHAVLVLWNDQAGVKDGFMRPMSRQEWEERAERLVTRGTSQAGCPPDFARWHVAEARKLNEKTGLPLKDHLQKWDDLIGAPPDDYQPPDPTAPVREASAEERQRWVISGAELFQLGDVERWFLEMADCPEFARRWIDLQSKVRLRGPEDRAAEGLKSLILEATDALLDENQKVLYVGRLLDLARVLAWRKSGAQWEAGARRAAAAALVLQEGEAPSSIPFCVELVQRTLRATGELLRRGEDLERYRYHPLKRHH